MANRITLQRAKEQGAALITVLVALMIISIMILEFQYAAIVERQLAYNDLNQLQAYYLAKAGVRVGLLRVNLYGRALKGAASMGKSFGNIDIKPYLEMIWSLPTPAFPPSKGSLGKLLKADKDAAEKSIAQTQITDGQYSQTITNESAKINLNFLVLPNASSQRPNLIPPANSLAEQVGIMLVTLLENFVRDSPDPIEEFGDLRPEELVYDIMDWVNPGAVRIAGGGKDTFYEGQNPPYKAKRNRFYSLDELKLVKGMNDYLFNKLRPHITVYSEEGRININSADSKVLRALYKDFSEDDITKLSEEKAKRGAWSTEKEFVDYITGTLGRSGFTTQYPNANDYPFTVSSQGFVVESLGIIQKSKSQVTRAIKVGVALSSGTSTNFTGSASTPADCAKQNSTHFFRPQAGLCVPRPTSQADCEKLLGRWEVSVPRCMVPDSGGELPITPPTGTGAASTGPKPPNAVKVLYWTES